jgi:hypothetical protein
MASPNKKPKTGGKTKKIAGVKKLNNKPKIKIKNKCDWRENKNSFQRPVHR